MPKHALVIGGTGMLRGAVCQMLKRFDIVSVIGRNTEGFQILEKESGKLATKLNRLQLDYCDYLELTNKLINSIKNFGDVSLCISWIHSSAPAAPLITAKILNHSSECFFYEILGTETINQTGEKEKREDAFKVFENIRYYQVALGYISENVNTNRWLTHDEISAGVLEAIDSGKKYFQIGISDRKNTG